ncbi:hypothetical protein HDV00_003132 [Rhizophlyctis rosea]|nr:hypothetical protein HDV00_003132 [Rhizophlyctis rosea]
MSTSSDVQPASPPPYQPELPLEMHLAIGKLTDPKTIRNLRHINKRHRALITNTDLVWTEAGWRYFTCGVKDCCYWAVRSGHAWILELYVSELDRETLDWMLKVAAKKGFEDVVKIILKGDGTDRNVRGLALLRAAEAGHLGTVLHVALERAAVEGHGDVVAHLIIRQNGSGHDTALCKAASRGHVDVTLILLTSGTTGRSCRRAPLACAAEKGHIKVVDLLLWTPDLHHTQRQLDQALVSAAKIGAAEIVRLLVGAGADIEVHVDGTFAVNAACSSGNVDTVKALMDAGERLEPGTYPDNDPLCITVEHGHLELVEFLLDEGCEFNDLGDWALRHAIARNHVELLKLLLEDGSLRLWFSEDKPLVHAAELENVEIMRVLLEGYAELRANDAEQGASPSVKHWQAALDVAADKGHVAVVQLLLQEELEVVGEEDWEGNDEENEGDEDELEEEETE